MLSLANLFRSLAGASGKSKALIAFLSLFVELVYQYTDSPVKSELYLVSGLPSPQPLF